MKMIPVLLKEQHRYTQAQLVNAFKADESVVVGMLKKLKAYGVLKAVKASEEQKTLSDLAEEDVEIADVEVGDNKYLYVFTFVGVLTFAGRVLEIYPKYLSNNDKLIPSFKKVLKVIEKFDSKEHIISLYNDFADSSSNNMLAVMLWLIKDYYENGEYYSAEDALEINGAGEILWSRTIDDSFAIILDNRPFYPEMYTRKRVNDDYDFFKRLHKCVITKCSEELREANILDLFEIEGLYLSDEDMDDFGETEYIVDRLDKELNIQFNTRKQQVLKIIRIYLLNSGKRIDDTDSFNMYGTNSFHVVWESVCRDILDDQLKRELRTINLPYPCKITNHDLSEKLIELIDRPVWVGELNGDKFKDEKDTLIPDTMCIFQDETGYKCVIFDAKYYSLSLDKNNHLKGQPGIESITKQYLYQMAYLGFLKEQSISYFRNCFIMPTEENHIKATGSVRLNFMSNLLKPKDIIIRLLPANEAYDLYLEGKKLDIKKLML